MGIMGDRYAEDLVKGKPSATDYLKIVIGVILILLGMVAFVMLSIKGFTISVILIVVGIFLIYYFGRNLIVEYEYIFTNSNVEIAKIYHMEKRKDLATFDLSEVAVVVPLDSQRYEGEMNKRQGMRVINCSSADQEGKKYAFILEDGGNAVSYVLEPSEKSLEVVKYYLKNNFYED